MIPLAFFLSDRKSQQPRPVQPPCPSAASMCRFSSAGPRFRKRIAYPRPVGADNIAGLCQSNGALRLADRVGQKLLENLRAEQSATVLPAGRK
jgi:hypothetical protein